MAEPGAGGERWEREAVVRPALPPPALRPPDTLHVLACFSPCPSTSMGLGRDRSLLSLRFTTLSAEPGTQ